MNTNAFKQITISLDMECHRIIEALARRNYRTKQSQLKVILLQEAERNNLRFEKEKESIPEVTA